MLTAVLLLANLAATAALVHHLDDNLPVVRFRLLTTFITISAVQLFFYGLWKIFLKPLCFSPFKHLPKPPGGSWINGHFREIMDMGNGEAEVKWMKTIPNNGIIHCRGLLNGERLVVSSQTALAKIASDNYTFIKPMAIKLLAGRVLGMGLVLTERDEHKQQRKLFLPPFAPKHIRDLYPVFWAKACEVTHVMAETISKEENGVEKEKDKNGIEIGEWAARVALDIITLSAMGKDFGSVSDAHAPLAKVYHAVLQPTLGHVVVAILKNFFPARVVEALPLKANEDQGSAYETIRGVCRDLLHSKKAQMADGQELKGRDILSVCLRYEEIAGVDEDEVLNQMTTILGAGHETISVGITWAIYMLCLHRDWQVRLREEVRATVPSPGLTEMMSSAHVERMPLLRAFLEEVLRWYPPIPMTMREPLVDTELDGLYVPKGTRIVVPIKAINREEKFWGADAKRFNPGRWLREGSQGREFNSTGGVSNKYGYLTFNHGPRSCVAAEFARAEMACVVAAWVGRFDLDLADERFRDEENMKTSNGNFSGKPLEGLYVRVKVVDGW